LLPLRNEYVLRFATMCTQLLELYADSREWYYQHAVDRCAAYGQPGHPIQRNIIYISRDDGRIVDFGRSGGAVEGAGAVAFIHLWAARATDF
jgi:hypothetical protein